MAMGLEIMQMLMTMEISCPIRLVGYRLGQILMERRPVTEAVGPSRSLRMEPLAVGSYPSLSGSEDRLVGVQTCTAYQERLDRIGDPIFGESQYDNSGFSVSLSKKGDVVAIGAWQTTEMVITRVMCAYIT